MPGKLTLLFGVHNHQPVGNLPAVFRKATEDCYRPFLETINKFPQLKSTLHFSGALIDWLLKNDPELLQIVKQMVKQGRLEILSGGYFEPVLPVIPERDRIGQIEMLNNFIRDYFEYEPQGLWLGERVWAPELISSLTKVGLKYILLDDFHLLKAGLSHKDLSGYYTIQNSTPPLSCFTVNKELRYLIPFSRPKQVIKYLKDRAKNTQNPALTIVDDGEKFGLWPGTQRWVYRKKWLEQFFQLLVDNQSWLSTRTISEYLHSEKPQGSIQVPAGGYQEIMQWSGGAFENFFSKYPEANRLHKRMLDVSARLARSADQDLTARRYLYMAQCNCPYWHGVFGGIYLAHLRHAVYANLIRAEAALEDRQAVQLSSEIIDLDQGTQPELMIKNGILNLFISAERGGAITELDYRPQAVNLCDGFSRRPEAYHQRVGSSNKLRLKRKFSQAMNIRDLFRSKEQGLDKFLSYDRYLRTSLLDHFLPSQLGCSNFKNLDYPELGDFINGKYALTQKTSTDQLKLFLQRTGQVNYRGQDLAVKITKELALAQESADVAIRYKLENLTEIPLEMIFGVEFNLALGTPNKEEIDRAASQKLSFADPVNKLRVSLIFDRQTNIWAFPIETISCSESGFERNYQQTAILAHWPISLKKTFHFSCNLNILRL
ncbi:alpha-amylase/4-alpha-glucanotransferase domain-containing protein [Candidatus Omnitrophota bacterium]